VYEQPQTTTPERAAQATDESGRNNQGADEPGYPMPQQDYSPRRVSYHGRQQEARADHE
jgi:hypothetical protein